MTAAATLIPNPDTERKARRAAARERREGFWFPEPKREELLTLLDELANDPPRQRERSIAIVAEANNGKSALVKRYLERHPNSRTTDRKIIPCIMIGMSQNTRVERLSVSLLRALKDVDPESGNHTQRILRFIALSKKVGLQLTFLDEFHDAASKDIGQPVLKCIKDLMNEHVKVVPVGTREMEKVLANDDQLSTRFQFRRGKLARIDNLGIVKALMMNISDQPEEEITDEMVKYVHKHTKGVLGHMCDLAEDTFAYTGALTLNNLKSQREFMECLDNLQ